MKEFFVGFVFIFGLVIAWVIGWVLKTEDKRNGITFGVPFLIVVAMGALSAFLYSVLDEKERIVNAEVTVSTGVHRVQVTDINPPKHYKITFVDLETGARVVKTISKHCNSYRQIVVGEVYKVAVSIKKNPLVSDKEYLVYSDLDLRRVFCPSK